jgi:dethiobiotin synthetase
MSLAFYVTASGTELGKTLVTAALAWQLHQQHRSVYAIKPIASGVDATQLQRSDTGILLAVQGKEISLENANAITPWRFSAPVSPHLAATQQENSLTAKDIRLFCESAIAQPSITLIEGAGGVLSPLVQGYTQADLLHDLSIPAIVVVGSYVGAISHSLCTLEAMQARGLQVAAVVISESENSATSLDETRCSIRSHMQMPVPLFTVPRICPKKDIPLWQQLPPLTGILDNDHTTHRHAG